jgi:hypothetical protein
MNLLKPLFEKILPLLESHCPACFWRRPARPHGRAIQLEFPWISKR